MEAPRLYIFEGCTNLIEQLKNAPTTKGRSVDIGDTRSVVGMWNLIAAQAVQRAWPEERITVTTEF